LACGNFHSKLDMEPHWSGLEVITLVMIYDV
jgi:hypothetical protein